MKAKKAVFPERSCRDHVWGEHIGYNCEIPELHKGPCVSFSVPASIQRREAWESQQENLMKEKTP